MQSILQRFMKTYLSKLATITTFILVWACILLLFNNQNDLVLITSTMVNYPTSVFEEKLEKLSSLQRQKTVLSVSISVVKIFYNLYLFLK